MEYLISSVCFFSLVFPSMWVISDDRQPERRHKIAAICIVLGLCAMLASAALAASPDINNDRIVDAADYGLILGGWGKVTDDNFAADVNRDGTVNGADLGIVLGAWGSIVRTNAGDGTAYLIPGDYDKGPSPFGPGFTRYSWGEWTTAYGDRRRAFSIDEKETP